MRFTIFLFDSVPFRFISNAWSLFESRAYCTKLHQQNHMQTYSNIGKKKSKFSRFKLPCIKPEDHTAKKDLTHFIVCCICAQRSHRKRTIRNKESGREWTSENIFMFTVTRHSHMWEFSSVLGTRYVLGGINLYWAKCAYKIHTI